jgi:hypothetical protein
MFTEGRVRSVQSTYASRLSQTLSHFPDLNTWITSTCSTEPLLLNDILMLCDQPTQGGGGVSLKHGTQHSPLKRKLYLLRAVFTEEFLMQTRDLWNSKDLSVS